MNSIAKENSLYKLLPADAVVIHEANIRTSSLKVAEAFGKQHKDVLRKIENLGCSADFSSAHFCANVENQQVGTSRRDLKYYEMTKDGFMFLVMGFTGAMAAQIKEAYIHAFNVMSSQIAEQRRPSEWLTPSEQQTLSEIVHKKASIYAEKGKALAEIWSRLHNKFRIAKYDQLPRSQLADAIVYISTLQLKTKPAPQETLSAEQGAELASLMRNISRSWVLNGDKSLQSWVTNRLRVEFNVKEISDIYQSDFQKACLVLNQMSADAEAFFKIVHEGRQYFIREVIGAGQPFTPWVARRMGGKDLLPNHPNWIALANALQKAG